MMNSPEEVMNNPEEVMNSPEEMMNNPEVVAFAGREETVSPSRESDCPWYTCTADMPYRIDAVPAIQKPDRHCSLRNFQQEVRCQPQWQPQVPHCPRQLRWRLLDLLQ